jgi:hypothetical protein
VTSGIDRSRLEKLVRSKLADYGIDASNFYVDPEKKSIIVLCSHITGKMKLFISRGRISLGSVVRDSMVSAHGLNIGGEKFGLIVIYCKDCFEKGLRMMIGEE